MIILRDSVLIVLCAAGVAILSNGIRKNGIPLIAKTPYEIYVPCPEQKNVQIDSISGLDARTNSGAYVFIDARSPEEYLKRHLDGSINVPYDYLYGVSDTVIAMAARVKKKRIAVYGDGGEPDPGRLLALELAARGIRNVCFIPEGIPDNGD